MRKDLKTKRLLSYPIESNPRFVIDDVETDKLPFPYAVMQSGDAATVAILSDKEEVLVNIEYCLPADDDMLRDLSEGKSHDGMLYKFPGGMQSGTETAEEIAIRETTEETGLAPEKLTLLGEPHYYVQRALGRDALFIARSHSEGKIHHGPNEQGHVTSLWITVEELQKQVLAQDPKTLNSHFLQVCAYLFAMKNTGQL